MKISFATLAAPGYGVREIAEMAALYGYDGVDLRVSHNKGDLSPDSGHKSVSDAHKAFSDSGVAISSLLCYNEDCFFSLGNIPEYESWLKRHIHIAEEIGAKAIRIFAYLGVMGDKEYFMGRFAETLGKTAETTDIHIYIQNYDGRSTLDETLYIINKAEAPNIKLAFSPEYCIMSGTGIDITPELAAKTGQLYISDIVKTGDRFEPAFPGEGVLKIPDIAGGLLGYGFDGYITFKWYKLYRPYLSPSEEALPRFIKNIKNMKNILA
jgi:sugar phosphate isomerase/epimerase